MKRLLLAPLLFILISTVKTQAHPISIEERAVDLVIAKYDKQLKTRLEGTGVNPSYMAEAQSKCNVTVRAGTHQPTTWSVMEWFEVNVCKGQVKLIDLTKR